jgi:putative ABC transport system permease protein
MGAVKRDLTVAVRVLRRRPAYAMAAAWTLALGIGTTVAIFCVVNAVLLRPLPYPDAHDLVTIRHHAPGLELPELENSPGTLRLYRDQANWLEALGAFTTVQRNLIGGPAPERIRMVDAEPAVFDVLRTAPTLGRAFNAADPAPEGASVVMLSHAFWNSRFGADPSVIGRRLQMDGRSVEVVGIMPPGFAFPEGSVDAYAPLYIDPEGPFGEFGRGMVARLVPGVSLGAAQARTDELQARLPEMFELSDSFLEQAGWGASVMRLQDLIVGEQVASTLWIVLGTVGFVFLIACANVANLFLVRAESRQKELAVRAAMGASGRRVASGFLAEALVLGAVGGLMGVALAWFGVDLLVSQGPQDLPRLAEVGLDATSLAFAGGISVLAALALGAIPMVRYAGRGLAGLLRDGGRASTDGRERHRARQVLVAGQLALAVVLLVGSGLMFRSFLALRAIDPGFDPADVLSVRMSLGEVSNPEGAAFYHAVADRVAALPGVTSVGLTSLVPVGSGSSNGGSFYIESRPRDEDALPPVALYKAIGADYLETLRQPLIEGRTLTRSDWEAGIPVVLVNRAFADQFFDGRAVGERIKWDEDREFAEIVGVVGNVREYGLREDMRPVAYLPLVVGDWPYPGMEAMTLLARTAPGLAPPIAGVRDIVHSLDSDVPLASIETLTEVLAADMAETSFTVILLGIASGVAVFLGAIGLFGVISYVVGQRTREIGVRVALGAREGEIRAMVLRQGAGVVAVGIVLGLGGAWALSSVMGAILFGVEATDPVVYALAPALLLGVAMIATWLPARRASRVDPIVALHAE